jgi:hypothetical protein
VSNGQKNTLHKRLYLYDQIEREAQAMGSRNGPYRDKALKVRLDAAAVALEQETRKSPWFRPRGKPRTDKKTLPAWSWPLTNAEPSLRTTTFMSWKHCQQQSQQPRWRRITLSIISDSRKICWWFHHIQDQTVHAAVPSAAGQAQQ